MLEDPNVFLSTVQIGITLVGVLAGAVGGATLSEALAGALQNVPYIGEYSDSIALGIVVISITILTLRRAQGRQCGSLRDLQTFFWLRVCPAPKQNPRPPTRS
ncbi:MAG: DUF21 domain-containing protein [Chloroflexi bacterium]|nr:DUF21 domain-containing protein [Chloroflexota bacterium]